jgi:cell division protein FtsL
MKMLAYLLLFIQFVYVLVLKLAALMASALVILFAALFARELMRNNYRVQSHGERVQPRGV